MGFQLIRTLDGSERIRMIDGELVPVTFRSIDGYTRGELEPLTWREKIAHIPTLASKFVKGESTL